MKKYDFTLMEADGNKISLSDYEGKNVIVYFYPKDNTSGCTIEALEFNDLKDEFAKYDTVIVGISRDGLDSHKKFKKEKELDFPLLSDEEEKIHEKFGVLKEKVKESKEKLEDELVKIKEKLQDDKDKLEEKIKDEKEKIEDAKEKEVYVERATFVFDKDGNLIKEYREVKPEGHAKKVLQFIKNEL